MNASTRPRRAAAGIVLVAVGVLLAWPAAANTVDFDSLILGTQYGTPSSLSPGDLAFVENGANVYVDEFFVSGNPYFNFAQVDPPFLGFGAINIMWLNNICIEIDFGAPGDARFEFLDLGGEVNIQVNGFGVVIEAPDFPSLGTFNVAPGVVMSTTWTPVGGGFMGTVDLQGPVQTLKVGGQELWVDAMSCNNGGGPAPCDHEVEYETLPVGTVFDGASYSPGDFLFNEDGIDVHAVEFDYGGGLLFHRMEVDPGFGPLGADHVMEINNIGQLFRLAPLGITTSQVTFEYIDYGGTENLQINGSVLMVGDLDTWSGMMLGGVHVDVVTAPYGGGLYGFVTLTGNVVELRVAGQEFWMDSLCVEEGTGGDDCDFAVDYESLPLGQVYGAPMHSPGDQVFTEDGIPVFVLEFDHGGGVIFNQMEVVGGFGPLGGGKVMAVNNIDQLFRISALGITTSQVTFEYLDYGGTENLQINGSPLIVGDLDTFSGMMLGGVHVHVATAPYGGGLYGFVTLTGDVQDLRVGGQEFWLDDVCVSEAGGGPGDCDWLVDHQSLAVGDLWGDPVGTPIGDVIFTEDGIPVTIGDFDAGGVITYNFCEVVPAIFGVGNGRVMAINNVTNTYEIHTLGVTTTEVHFVYLDQGGIENLQVNGAPRYVGELDAAPVNIAPGVTCVVNTWMTGGGLAGHVVLTGDVQRLLVGGQEFFIDEICVIGDGVGPVTWCDHLSDIESLTIGDGWGFSFGDPPGTYMFTEDAMDTYVGEFTDGGGTVLYGDARVDAASAAWGSDANILTINNVGVKYDLSALGTVDKVYVDYFDGAGVENLTVNGGTLHVDELDLMPNAIAPGITLTVYEYAGPGFDHGTFVLEGPVTSFVIGGQQFAIDNVCVRLVGSTTAAPAAPIASVSLEPNYPNPFNPSTTLRFNLGRAGHVRLAIHDVAGRLVRTLVDEQRAAGSHSVQWDGRGDAGNTVAAGIYFVRVASGKETDIRKIALIK